MAPPAREFVAWPEPVSFVLVTPIVACYFKVYPVREGYRLSRGFEADCTLVHCEHGRRCISRGGDYDREPDPIMTHFQGKRTNSPNDVAGRPTGRSGSPIRPSGSSCRIG